MIYKDSIANRDTEYIPGMRGEEKCVNCNYTWSFHYGWSCHSAPVRLRSMPFRSLDVSVRYLTPSMIDSISVPKEEDNADTTISSDNAEFKFFAKTQKGHCPCGIVKSNCDYHR